MTDVTTGNGVGCSEAGSLFWCDDNTLRHPGMVSARVVEDEPFANVLRRKRHLRLPVGAWQRPFRE